MDNPATLLEMLGGEEGCRTLSAAFYARVGKDPVLRPLFPGKSLRCAIEEFAAFLIQFLGGDEEQTQKRWWLSLRESHARFAIAPAQRSAWLKHMRAALDAAPVTDATRETLNRFFLHTSAYVMGADVETEQISPEKDELAARWKAQRHLDEAVAAIAAADDETALALAPMMEARPAVFVGLLSRMMQSRRAALIGYVESAIRREPRTAERRFAGKLLLHFASGAGAIDVVDLLLRQGASPNALDRGGHTPLYCVANECGTEEGPAVVRVLVKAGAAVNACGGVTRATPLHMAARRGHVAIAEALLDCGAAIHARDARGDTPLQRALNCRRTEVAKLLTAAQAPL
ncbi:MAG: ankyrin repeat domain-containing protein [Bryobacteraceae bacterium]